MARILVVDDDALLTQLLETALALDGHEIETASTGLVALDKLARRAFDAVVTDVRMPQLDGIGLYRELTRRHPQLSRRVIFVTGASLSTDHERTIAASGAVCLPKPIDLGRLRDAVRRIVPG
jgi:two-component system NtrC family sensor kinase